MMQQTTFPFEVVIGEDCSTDKTRMIVQEYADLFPEEVKPVFHSSNVGGARNGYEYCYPRLQGKYIAICEGDDYWTDPYKLQKQFVFLEQHPEHSFCFHKVANVDENGQVLHIDKASDVIINYKATDIFHISIPTLSVVFRKCFDFVPGDIYRVASGDTFLFGLLAHYGEAADLGFVGAHYRTHPGGIFSSRKMIYRYLQSIQTRRVMLQASCFDENDKKELKKEIRRRKIMYIKQFIRKGKLLNVFKILLS